MGLLAKYAGFRLLWTGQLLSQLGNAVFLIMGLWEIQLRSPVLLAVAGVATALPAGLAVFGGVYVDRMDPRQVMLWTDVMRGAAVALGLLALTMPGHLIVVIIALLGINSLGNALFGPAESVVVPWLVSDGDLAGANGLYSLTSQLSSTVGMAVGGAAIAAVGVSLVFGVDLASFWLSALAIWLMMRTVGARPRPARSDPSARAGFVTELVEGFRSLKTLPAIIQLMPLAIAANFAATAAYTLLPYWTRAQLHSGAAQFGLLEAAFAGGLVVGSLATASLRRWPTRVVSSIAFALQGLLFATFIVMAIAPGAEAVQLLAGICNGAGNALIFTVFQRIIPDHLRGRVFGMLFSLLTVATPLGAVAAGALLHVLPLWWSWALLSTTSVALSIGLMVLLPHDIDTTGAPTEPVPAS
jgi:MFS family permease